MIDNQEMSDEEEPREDRTWQSSHDKWSGDLWERLTKEKIKLRRELKGCTIKGVWELAFTELLWESCAYCDKYSIQEGTAKEPNNPCPNCPLYKANVCCHSLFKKGFLTSEMEKYWIFKQKKKFLKAQEQFLKILKKTKWEK